VYHYFVYGFHIESEIELPPLVTTHLADQQRPDLRIRSAHDDEPLCHDLVSGLSISHTLTGKSPVAMIRLHWRSVGCFALITQIGLSDMIVRPIPDLEPAILANFIINNALGIYVCVHPQTFVFHASAIHLRDDYRAGSPSGGIVFAGRSGAGKSTLAAALIARGHTLLADDLAVIDLDTSQDSRHPDILPAFPQLKLDDLALQQLNLDPAALPHIHSAENKRAYRPACAPNAAPIRALYLLDDDDAPAPSVEPLTKQEAFAAFIGASYNAHLQGIFNVDVLAALGRTKAFMGDCAALAQNIPVRRLKRPRDLSRLSAVVDCIEADVKTL